MSRDKTTSVRTGRQIVVGLDIGSSKISVVIGTLDPERELPDIVGVGTAHSVDGINAGRVLNVSRAADAIREAVEAAEKLAGIDVKRVSVGIAGRSVESMQGNGQITISKAGDREITDHDVARVIEQSSAIQLPPDKEILDVIPNAYMLDGTPIGDPCGCTGGRREAKVQLVLVSPQDRDNLVKAVERAGLDVDGVYLGTLASAEAVLSEEEKRTGVALVDLGACSTNIAVFVDGTLRYAHSIPFGGKTVTHDLAAGLHANDDSVETIKCMHGACRVSAVEDGTIKVPGIGNREAREVKRSEIASYIEPRVREIFADVRRELDDNRFHDALVAGVVLVGGGSALRGVKDVAAQILGLPVVVGTVQMSGEGLSNVASRPIFTESIGLVHLAAKAARQGNRGGAAKQAGAGFFGALLGFLRRIF